MTHRTVQSSLGLAPSSRKVTEEEQVLKGKEEGLGALEGRLVSGPLSWGSCVGQQRTREGQSERKAFVYVLQGAL